MCLQAERKVHIPFRRIQTNLLILEPDTAGCWMLGSVASTGNLSKAVVDKSYRANQRCWIGSSMPKPYVVRKMRQNDITEAPFVSDLRSIHLDQVTALSLEEEGPCMALR